MLVNDYSIRKSLIINRRMFIIGAAKVIIFTGIIARLFSLQISDNKKYSGLSDKNRLREWRLPPVRGEFVDYFVVNVSSPNTPDLRALQDKKPLKNLLSTLNYIFLLTYVFFSSRQYFLKDLES